MKTKATPQRPRKITATAARFIKLGERGEWEQECIQGKMPCIRIGFGSSQHQECLSGGWHAIHKHWAASTTKGKATEFTNQIKTFYTADEKTLWITFHQRKLWWCFAGSKVEELVSGDRIRRSLDGWSCSDSAGNSLHVDGLSGELTKVQGFRGTICRVDQLDYLLQRLNGESPGDVAHAEKCLAELESAIQPLVGRLGWKDFELLCDLLFRQAGWQRTSPLGRTEKSVDMALLSPVTGRRALVQVKSQADLKSFRQCASQLQMIPDHDENFFVVHQPSLDLQNHPTDPKLFLLTGQRLAALIVSSGLTAWLVNKVR